MATRTLISRAQLQRPSGRRAYRVALVLTVVVFTVVFIGPIYFLFTDGFKSTQEVIQTPPTFWPQGWHLSVYQQAWNELDLGKLLFNTLYYAFGALVFQLVFDVAAAYAFSKLRPRFGNVILGMMLASLMIPAAVLLVPQYVTATDVPLVHMNLINSPEAIWLPSVASAFNIFLLKRFFDSIPDEIMQAAAIDGAGAMRTLRSVVLPMSRPILGVVSIFAMVTVWKDFLWPLLVEPLPSNQTLNAGISSLSQGVPQNVLIAASAIAAVPTIVLFLFFQRSIVSGLTAGGLKG